MNLMVVTGMVVKNVILSYKKGRLHNSSTVKSKGINNPKYTVDELEVIARDKCKQIINIKTMTFKKHVKDGNDFQTMQTVYGVKKVTNTLDER